MAGNQSGATIQSMPDDEYEEYEKLSMTQRSRYLSFRNVHKNNTVAQNIALAKDDQREKINWELGLTNSAVSAYERAVSNFKLGWADETTVKFAKAELRKRRSELIKLEKEATSGATGMRVRLALMQVRNLLK